MLRGGQLMSRIKKPPKEMAATISKKGRGRKAKGKLVRGSSSRARETSPIIDEDENADDEDDSDSDVEDRIQQRVRELGDTLTRKLEEDVQRIFKSSEASIIESVTTWMRRNFGHPGFVNNPTHGASPPNWSGFSENPGLNLSPINVPPPSFQENQSPRSAEQRGAEEQQSRLGNALNEKDVPTDVSGGAGNATFTSNQEEDVSATLDASRCDVTAHEVDAPVSTTPPDVTPQVQAMDEDVGFHTSEATQVPVAVSPNEETNERATTGDTRANKETTLLDAPRPRKRKADEVPVQSETSESNDQQQNDAPGGTSTETPPRSVQHVFRRRSRRQRFKGKVLGQDFHCSTNTHRLLQHPKEVPASEEDVAVATGLDACLQSLKKKKSFAAQDSTKITYRDVADIVVSQKPISSKMVDKLSMFVLTSPTQIIEGSKLPDHEILVSDFIPMLSRLSPQFKKSNRKEEFLFPRAIYTHRLASDGSGMYPSLKDAGHIYVPFQIKKNH